MGPAARSAAAEREADLRPDQSRLALDRAHIVHCGTTSAETKGSPRDTIPPHGLVPPWNKRVSEADERKMNGQASRDYRLYLTDP
jgi:hypothetical protein